MFSFISAQKSNYPFHIKDLPPYPLGSVAQAVLDARMNGRDIIDLGQFNPTIAPPAIGVDVLVQSVLQPHNHRYSSSQGITMLRKAFADYYRARHSVEFDSNSEVVVTLGTKEGFSRALQALIQPGDTVILPVPAYPIHSAAISISGGQILPVPLFDFEASSASPSELNGNSEFFFSGLVRAYEESVIKPKVLVLSFPNNPTTMTATKDFFARVVDFALSRGIIILHDFAYADLCYNGYKAPSIFSVESAKQCAIEFYSLSKGFSVAGWRIGCCLGNSEVIAGIKKLKSYLDAGAFQPLQVAAISLLKNYTSITENVCDEYRSRRDVLVAGLKSMGWRVETPRSTVYLWTMPPKGFSTNGEEVCRTLFEKCGVAVFPGSGFDNNAKNFIRFSLSENESRLRIAIERIGNL